MDYFPDFRMEIIFSVQERLPLLYYVRAASCCLLDQFMFPIALYLFPETSLQLSMVILATGYPAPARNPMDASALSVVMVALLVHSEMEILLLRASIDPVRPPINFV